MPQRSVSEFENDPRARRYLDLYTDPCGHYAFTTYDNSAIHRGPMTAADVLMANLLSLRLGWQDVIPLFAKGGEERFVALRIALDNALAEARRLPALEDCTMQQVAMPALRRANETAEDVGPYNLKSRRSPWTIVTVSKVLHRLSPNIPLIDSHVKKFYGTGFAGEIRSRMREDLIRNREWMTPLAKDYPAASAADPHGRHTHLDGRDESSINW